MAEIPAVTEALAKALPPERVVTSVAARSKKHALEILSELLADPEGELSPSDLFCSLIQRERLGSTGLGDGIALPHGRAGHLEAPRAALITLDAAVDYDAADGAAVDVMLAVLVPEADDPGHLEILAEAARLFGDGARREALRRAPDDGGLRVALLAPAGSGPGAPATAAG